MRIVIDISDQFQPDEASALTTPAASTVGTAVHADALNGGAAPEPHPAAVAATAIAASSLNGGAYGGQLAMSDGSAQADDVINGGAAPAQPVVIWCIFQDGAKDGGLGVWAR